jgi:hypothetical protein
MSVIDNYQNWKKHYTSMIEGKIFPNKNVYLVNNANSQSGQGLRMVSPASQKDSMSRAIVKKYIKRPYKKKKAHSSTKRGRITSINKTKAKRKVKPRDNTTRNKRRKR